MGWFTRSKPKADAKPSARLWARERDEAGFARDLAKRVVVEDISGLQRDGFIVEQGTEALLFRNGKLIERCLPGFHKPLEEGSKQADTGQTVSWQQLEVVLVESGDTPFTFTIRRQATQDGVPVEVIVAVPVRVADAGLMLRHAMQGQESYPTTAVKQLLFPIIRVAVGELCSGHRAEELKPSRERDERFEGELRLRADATLSRVGLELGPLQRFEVGGEALAERSADFGELAEREHAVEMARRRAELAGRLRSDAVSQKILEAKDGEALAAALADVEDAGILRESERRELLRRLEWERADAVSERQDELATRDRLRAAISAEVERSARRLSEQEELLQRSHSEELAKRRRAEELREGDHHVERDRRGRVGEVTTTAEVNTIRRSEALQSARGEEAVAEVDRRVREQDEASELSQQDARVRKALEWKEQYQKQKQAKAAAEQELEALRVKQEEARADSALQRKLTERETELKGEISRMSAASELSVEKMLALKGDGAALAAIAELRKTEAYKDMSAEQLQALAASANPELARALAEAHLRSGERQDAMVKQTLDRQQQGYERGFSAMESLARSLGGSRGAPAAGPTPVPVSHPPRSTRKCSNCGHPSGCGHCGGESQPPARFCSACGEPLPTTY